MKSPIMHANEIPSQKSSKMDRCHTTVNSLVSGHLRELNCLQEYPLAES